MIDMAKSKFIALIIAVCMGLLALLSGISHANPEVGVMGSRHDLSSGGGGSYFQFVTGEVCVFCHVPHGASGVVREKTYIWNSSGSDYQNTGGAGNRPLLLWNRALANAGSSEGVNYTLYRSSSLNSFSGRVRVYSLLCMSCHDGVGSLNVLLNYPNDELWDGAEPLTIMGAGGDQIGDISYPAGIANPNIGERWTASDSKVIDLSNDHPVSIDYTSSHPDVGSGLNNPADAGFDSAVRLFPTETQGACDFYTAGSSQPCQSLECSSCHNPHNEGSASAGTFPFLVKTVHDSALCLACHKK